MSDQHLDPAAEPEYLGEGPAAPPPTRRPRQRLLLAGAVLAVGAVGAGGWALAQLMSGGDDPAVAVPGNAVGYLAVDLDPSAAQKIEALRILKKFPAVDEELDLGVRDDLRRWVFEQMKESTSCPVDYDEAVEPWLGNRMAVAAVPDGDSAVPLLVLQVEDQDAARSGVTALEECAADADVPGSSDEPSPGPAGVAFVGDYMLVTEDEEDAARFAADAEGGALADNGDFQDWMDEAGDPGVVTAYASSEAPRLMSEAARAEGVPPMGGPGLAGAEELYRDFDGMAAVLRFDEGAVEAEVVARGLPTAAVSSEGLTGPSLADLPDTTALAFTVSLPDGWLRDYTDMLSEVLGTGAPPEDFWDEMSAGTGLDLPEDIEALLGDGFSLSFDGSADFKELEESPDVPEAPLALRIAGDPAEIRDVLDELLAQAGPFADPVVVESGDGVVVAGLEQAYVDSLLEGGSLGDSARFRDVVPEAEGSPSALYVDFDAGDWIAGLAESEDERANLAPLDALGLSGWRDGDVQHGLLRLTTD